MAKVENKDPRALLREMMDLISVELSSLRARSAGTEGIEDREEYSKQLQRLITSIRGTIKDTAAILDEEKNEAEGLSDADIARAMLEDPVQRAVLVQAFTTFGWTVTEPESGTKPRARKKKVMVAPGAKSKRKARSAQADAVVDAFVLPALEEEEEDA